MAELVGLGDSKVTVLSNRVMYILIPANLQKELAALGFTEDAELRLLRQPGTNDLIVRPVKKEDGGEV